MNKNIIPKICTSIIFFHLSKDDGVVVGIGLLLDLAASPGGLERDLVDDPEDVVIPDSGDDLPAAAADVVVVVVPGGLVEGVGDGAGRERPAHVVPHVVPVGVAGAHPALNLVRDLLVHLPTVLLRLLVALGALDRVAPAVALLLGHVLAVVLAGDLVAVLVGLPVAGLVLLPPRHLPLLVPALRLVDGLAGGRVVGPDLAALAVVLPVLLARLGRLVVADLLVLGVVHGAPAVVALLPPLVVALVAGGWHAQLVVVGGLALGLELLPVLDVLDDPALRLRPRPRRTVVVVVVDAVLRGGNDSRHGHREDQGQRAPLHFGR